MDEVMTWKLDLRAATPTTTLVLGSGLGTLSRGMDLLARDIIVGAQTTTEPIPDQPVSSPG
jgi:hypothetical protein